MGVVLTMSVYGVCVCVCGCYQCARLSPDCCPAATSPVSVCCYQTATNRQARGLRFRQLIGPQLCTISTGTFVSADTRGHFTNCDICCNVYRIKNTYKATRRRHPHNTKCLQCFCGWHKSGRWRLRDGWQSAAGTSMALAAPSIRRQMAHMALAGASWKHPITLKRLKPPVGAESSTSSGFRFVYGCSVVYVCVWPLPPYTDATKARHLEKTL